MSGDHSFDFLTNSEGIHSELLKYSDESPGKSGGGWGGRGVAMGGRVIPKRFSGSVLLEP